MPSKEVKRQEIIFEFVYTEEDYVEDLEILKKVLFSSLSCLRSSLTTTCHPIHAHHPLPSQFFLEPVAANTFQIPQTETFIKNVFAELLKVAEANGKFCRALKERQMENVVVPHIADIFVKHVWSSPYLLL